MKHYDYCPRTYFDAQNNNQKRKIRIPRYKCTNKECPHKYHRILPLGLLLPYARYTADVIEVEIDNMLDDAPRKCSTAEAEDTTIRNWGKRFIQFIQYMNAAVIRGGHIPKDTKIPADRMIDGFRELSIFRSIHPMGWLSKIASQTVEILLCGSHSICNACPP